MKLVSAFAAFILSTAAVTVKAQDYPPMRLKYGSVLPANNVVSDVDKFFVERVKQKSNGKIVIDIYWTSALGKPQEMLPLISAGAVDFTMFLTGQYSETPLLGFMNALPLAHFDSQKVVDISKALYEQSGGIQKELDKIGAKVLLVRPTPIYQLLCRKPYETLADLRGAKLRSYGAYVPVMWQALGANPVNVSPTELYDSLSKGIFDCAYWNPPFHADAKLYEVAKYLIDVDFGVIELAPIVVPVTVWNQWPAPVQKLFLEVAREAEVYGIKHIRENSLQSVDFMVKNGVRIVKFKETAQLRKAVPNMVEIWLQKQKDAGRGADAEQIVQLMKARSASN